MGIFHDLASCFRLGTRTHSSLILLHSALSMSYVPCSELGTSNTKVNADKPAHRGLGGKVASRLNREFQCS